MEIWQIHSKKNPETLITSTFAATSADALLPEDNVSGLLRSWSDRLHKDSRVGDVKPTNRHRRSFSFPGRKGEVVRVFEYGAPYCHTQAMDPRVLFKLENPLSMVHW